MARPKKATDDTKKSKGLVGLHSIRRLWKAVSVKDWYNLLQEIAPQNKWELHNMHSIKGCCPYHPEDHGSFYLTFNKNMGKCFGAGCGKFVTDIVSMVAKLKSCSYTEALLFLNARFEIDKIIGGKADELNKYHNVQEMKKQAAMAMNTLMRDALIGQCPEELKYCLPAAVYLAKGRGIDLDSMPHLPLGIYGKPEHIKQRFSPDAQHLLQLYDDYFGRYDKTENFGAIVFHYNDSPGTISRFKLRYMERDAYKMLCNSLATCEPLQVPTVEAKKLGAKSFIYLDDPYTDEVGVYGLHRYQFMVGQSEANAYVTEGEFDALSVMVGQDKVGAQTFMQLAAGGSGSVNLGFLRDYGVRNLWLVPDHEVKSGDDWASTILRCKNNFSTGVTERPLTVKIFTWPAGLAGFDLDEVVQHHGYDVIEQYLHRERSSYFINAYSWVMAKCTNLINTVKKKTAAFIEGLDLNDPTSVVQQENALSEQRSILKEILIQGFAMVHDPSDRIVYINHYKTEEGIDISPMDLVSKAMYSLDTMEGTIARVQEELDTHFAPAYYEAKASGNQLYFWSKRKSEIVATNVQEKALAQMVAQYVGRELVVWMDSILEHSPVYLQGCEDSVDPLTKYKRKFTNGAVVLSAAIHGMLGKLQNKNELLKLAQGIHFHDLPPSCKREGLMYYVNGKYVFRGRFDKETGLLEWDQLNNVVDDGILFALSSNDSWSFATDASDLYAGRAFTPEDTYRKLRIVLDGWQFEHHATVAEYLAAYIMAVPVMRAIGEVSLMFLTGEPESGKTSFLAGLLGGTRNHQHSVPSVLESVVVATDSTPASMYQTMEGSSLLYIIDEAETSSEHNTDYDKRLQELQRYMNSIPQSGITIRRGGQTKDQVTEYYIRMPILMAGINPPSNHVLLSRMLVVNTKKELGRKPIAGHIGEHFSDTEIETLRHAVSTGLLHHVPSIMQRRRALCRRLMEVTKGVAPVSERFIMCVLTPLTIYELAGGDPVALYLRLLNDNKDRLSAIHNSTGQSELINACLYTDALKTANSSDVVDLVSAKYLIKSGSYNLLNNSGCGLYVMENEGWLVFVWKYLKYSILNRNHKFGFMDAASLRELATKCVYTKPLVSVPEHNHITATLQLDDVRSSAEYSVVDVAYLMGDPLYTQEITTEGQTKPVGNKTVTAVGDADPESGIDRAPGAELRKTLGLSQEESSAATQGAPVEEGNATIALTPFGEFEL